MYFVGWQIFALVFLLLGGCLFLLWRYVGWRTVWKLGIGTVLVAVTLAVLLASTAAPPRYSLTMLQPSAVSPPETASVERAEPDPEPTPAASPAVPAVLSPEPEPQPSPEAAPEPSSGADQRQEEDVESSYILNTSSKKFHRPSCADAARMKESNRGTADSRADAINRGYTPCKNCKP